MRSDGELANWYTQDEWLGWGGEAVDYGPAGGRMRWSMSDHDHDHADWGAGRPWREGDPIPAPIVSTLPVRSRSAGRWSGDGM